MVQIEILSGPDAGKVIDLGLGTHVFGRAKTNALVVAMESVSGRHLEVQITADGCVRFRDLGSTNGTWSGGVQVQEGEWFSGSELRLGSASLRLVDPSVATTQSPSEDEDVHRRAREAALAGGRRVGPLQLILALTVVIAGSGGAWWASGRGEQSSAQAASKGQVVAVGSVQHDAIENYGKFEDKEAWTLGKGLVLTEGLVQSEGENLEIQLNRSFTLTQGALRLEATVDGLHVQPLLSWGRGTEEDGVEATWQARDLALGSATLPLPAEARWFQLRLLLEGRGSLRDLQVHEVEGIPVSQTTPFGKVQWDGANLVLRDSSRILLAVHGQGGSWVSIDGGMQFEPTPGATLSFAAKDGLLQSGSFLIFAQGGPVGLAPGVRVEQSPGLLIGGGAYRFMVSFDTPESVRSSGAEARISVTAPVTLLWDLHEALTDAARLSQEISRSAHAGQERELLAATARLLRELPLDEEKIQEALLQSREAIERGRKEFSALQLRASGALFVGSGPVMSQLQEQVRALADRFPGTAVAGQASDLAQLLDTRLQEVYEVERRSAEDYRKRVQLALASTYPLLSHWIQQETH